jgi:hypothetical protein
MTQTMIKPAGMRMSAALTLTSNGDSARSAKVTLVARTGDVAQLFWGPTVHDFAGMRVKSKIPLDYAHNPHDSIGYLNKFETGTGDLVCSGAVVPVGAEAIELVQKLDAGVPYEASIEFGDDCLLEYVDEGYTATVNGREFHGPLTIVREWTLKAVAICKFGQDGNTSSELQMSAEKNHKGERGFLYRFSKQQRGDTQMDQTNEETQVAAVEAVDAVEQPEAVATAEAEATWLSANESIPAEVTATVEAEKPAEAEKNDEPVHEFVHTASDGKQSLSVGAYDQIVDRALKAVEAVDPRAEFKQFVTEFGGDRAADYYAKGLTMSQATSEYVKSLKADNDQMKTRLAAMSRGADKPISFSDGVSREAGKPTLTSLIRTK